MSQTDKNLSEIKTLSGYNYKELTNGTFSENENYPLIIALHWMGTNPDNFSKYLKGFKKTVRVLLVEAPYPLEEGYSFYRTHPINYYDLQSDKKAAILIEEVDKLSCFVESVVKKYNSPKKPVIIGASQGGDLSYMMAIRYGDMIGLSCPLLATIENELITQCGKNDNCAIVAFHGIEDPIVSIEDARNHIKQLTINKYNSKIIEYTDCGHEITKKMQSDYINLISKYFWEEE